MKTLFRLSGFLGLCIIMGLFPVTASAQRGTDLNSEGIALRILCISVLPGADEMMIATKDEEGKWIVLPKTVTIRSNFVSEWIPAQRGTCYLVKKTGEDIVPLGSFVCPAGSKRFVIVLLANKSTEKYMVDVVDPESMGFSKGKALVANYSSQTAIAKLGAAMSEVESGQKTVIEPIPDDNGMYRMTLGYINNDGKPIPCYDRYVDYTDQSRDFLLLFPDRKQPGFSVFSLAEFGPFE